MSQFYAYLWLREDRTPYYVGKGCGPRAFLKRNHLVPPPKDRSRIIILNRVSEVEAFETEKELISNWGRKDIGTGCLRNMSNGGEGNSGCKTNVLSGHLQKISSKGGKVSGALVGKRNAETGRMSSIGKQYGGLNKKEHVAGSKRYLHERWHLNRRIINPSCQHCVTAVVSNVVL